MRAFTCPRCAQLVPFEAVACLACGTALGFDPDVGEIVAAEGRARCANERPGRLQLAAGAANPATCAGRAA